MLLVHRYRSFTNSIASSSCHHLSIVPIIYFLNEKCITKEQNTDKNKQETNQTQHQSPKYFDLIEQGHAQSDSKICTIKTDLKSNQVISKISNDLIIEPIRSAMWIFLHLSNKQLSHTFKSATPFQTLCDLLEKFSEIQRMVHSSVRTRLKLSMGPIHRCFIQ